MKIWFVTNNKGKAQEVRQTLEPLGLDVEAVPIPVQEIQADSTQAVALQKSESVRGLVPEPYFSEDAGLAIDALGGFPGPYSAYVYRTLGNAGILRLLEARPVRGAVFRADIAVVYGPGPARAVHGEVHGTIAEQSRGAHGFGFDPIFIPEGQRRTFAEMTLEEKSRISHRGRALLELARLVQTLPVPAESPTGAPDGKASAAKRAPPRKKPKRKR